MLFFFCVRVTILNSFFSYLTSNGDYLCFSQNFFLNVTSHTILHLCRWLQVSLSLSSDPPGGGVSWSLGKPKRTKSLEWQSGVWTLPCTWTEHLCPRLAGLSTVLWVIGYGFAETTDFSNFTVLLLGSQPSVQKPVLWKEPQPENHLRFLVPTLCQFPWLLSLKWVAGTESFLKALKPMKLHDSSVTATSLHFHASPKAQLDSVNSHPPRSETEWVPTSRTD